MSLTEPNRCLQDIFRAEPVFSQLLLCIYTDEESRPLPYSSIRKINTYIRGVTTDHCNVYVLGLDKYRMVVRLFEPAPTRTSHDVEHPIWESR